MTIINKNTPEEELIEILLNNRHVSKKNWDNFLSPISPKLLKPQDFGIDSKELDKVVKIINSAISKKKNILIYGDYDVDGITATAILWQVLYHKNAKVTPFVPDREIDGYGIKADSFFRIQDSKKIQIDLLITVDNGIVATKELKKIVKSGTKVVVIDHHVSNDSLPKDILKIHSTLTSGSVLSWIVATKISKTADLGLAALGAVADCVSLNGINRNIVYHGLQALRFNPNPGIKKIIEISGVKQESLSTYDLGFVFGPRINAVGRLSNPTDALRLLCSQTSNQANKYASILDSYNKERQLLQQESLDLAYKKIDQDIKTKNKLIFIADKYFHPGIIGLIAGRLTEKYYLPSIIISVGKNISKGSCRSIKELNIIDSLRQFEDDFIDLGGHSGAAGFSIKTENILNVKKKLIRFVNLKLSNIVLKPEIFLDAQMELSAVTVKNCNTLKKLEPFGIDNPEPVFLFKQVKVVEKRLLGPLGNHLKLKIDDPKTPINENIKIDSIAFKKGEYDSKIKVGDYLNFTASLSLNTWNGYTTPQLVVKEFIS